MQALCNSCGTVRGEYVNECTVCIVKADNVLLRKEIARLNENLDELKELVCELRKEKSVRPKVCESIKTRREGVTEAVRSSDSPSQEDERGRAELVDRSKDNWYIVRSQGTKIRMLKAIQPVNCSNRFDCLPDGEGSERPNGNAGSSDAKAEALLIGDSMVRYLDRTFQNKDRRKRMRVCYPGARVNDIVDRIDSEIEVTNVDSNVIVHVGTNDVGQKRSEELINSYRRLIQKMKDSGRKCMISGILPRLGAGQEWGSRALGVNERVRRLCISENIRFLDLWRDFQKKEFFAEDGVHLSRKGVELFSTGLESFLSKN